MLFELVQADHIASVFGASGGGVRLHIWDPALLQLYVFRLLNARTVSMKYLVWLRLNPLGISPTIWPIITVMIDYESGEIGGMIDR
jgi:hypothetical protein